MWEHINYTEQDILNFLLRCKQLEEFGTNYHVDQSFLKNVDHNLNKIHTLYLSHSQDFGLDAVSRFMSKHRNTMNAFSCRINSEIGIFTYHRSERKMKFTSVSTEIRDVKILLKERNVILIQQYLRLFVIESLQRISLASIPLTNECLSLIAQNNPTLTGLYFLDSPICNSVDGFVDILSKCKQLTQISFYNSATSSDLLAAFKNPTTLKYITIEFCSHDVGTVVDLTSESLIFMVQQCPNLIELTLSGEEGCDLSAFEMYLKECGRDSILNKM